MSQQSRRALPPPHSFFCSSTCSTWQVLRAALRSYDSWTTGISLHNLRHHWCQRRSRFTMTLIFFFLVPSFLCLCSVTSSPSLPESKICSWGVLPIPYFSTFVHSLSYLHSIPFPLFLSYFHSLISFVPSYSLLIAFALSFIIFIRPFSPLLLLLLLLLLFLPSLLSLYSSPSFCLHKNFTTFFALPEMKITHSCFIYNQAVKQMNSEVVALTLAFCMTITLHVRRIT